MQTAPTETMEFAGIAYRVVFRKSPADHRAAGLGNLASALEESGIVSDIVLQRMRGAKFYRAYQRRDGRVHFIGTI